MINIKKDNSYPTEIGTVNLGWTGTNAAAFFRENPEVKEKQKMSPYSGFSFKIMRQVKIIFRGLAVFGEFSKYEMR